MSFREKHALDYKSITHELGVTSGALLNYIKNQKLGYFGHIKCLESGTNSRRSADVWKIHQGLETDKQKKNITCVAALQVFFEPTVELTPRDM